VWRGAALGFWFLASGFWCFAVSAGPAAEPETRNEKPETTQTSEPWRVLLEPSFMHREVAWPVPGADRTVIAPVVLNGDEYLFPSKKVWDSFHLDDAEIQRRGAIAAAQDLATLKPRYERDRKQVIQYAELKSDRPIVASAVLAPNFLDLFRDTLGDQVYLVVPNRFTAYVFPVLASNYQEYYPMVLEAYHDSTWPVSVEVFELGPKGMRTVGMYREP
jgi:hypothetical protein